jgi:copper(I)-binding protein
VRSGTEPEESTKVIPSSRGISPLRGLFIVAAAALIPAVAGCESGSNAPTQEWHQPTAGASAVVSNTMRINNMFVLGPTPGFELPPGASAGMFFALSNGGAADKLISISAPGSASGVQVPIGGINIGRDQSLLLTGPSPRVLLRHLTRSLHGGQYVVVTMDFQSAGHVTLRVPVMPRAAFYSTFSPAPRLFIRPKTTPSPVVSGTPAATPTASPSPTPTS